MSISTKQVEALMKRCWRGVGGRNALNDAHDIMAECYGKLGALVHERDKLLRGEYTCDQCLKRKDSEVNDNGDESELIDVYATWIVGHDAYPVAMFRYEEHATEWARENYFGNWLMKVIPMQLPPFATESEWEEARIEGKKLAKKFAQLENEKCAE